MENTTWTKRFEKVGDKKENETLLLKLGGMQCSFCVDSIQKALLSDRGIIDVGVSLAHEEVLVKYHNKEISKEKIIEALKNMGFKVRDPSKLIALEQEKKELRKAKIKSLIALLNVLIFSLIMGLMYLNFRSRFWKWIGLLLSFVMIFLVGFDYLAMSVYALRRKILNQHVLMEFGAFGGFLGGIIGFFVGNWPTIDFFGASVFIVAYHVFSGYVGGKVRFQSSQAISNLLELQPLTARVINNNEEKIVDISEIKKGDLVKILPGEKVPVDGTVMDGESMIDFSLVTGESLPVHVKKGDFVIGGALNHLGALIVRVERTGSEMFLNKVAKSIKEARALRPRIILTVEKVLRFFVPSVLSAAIIALFFWIFVPFIIGGEPLYYRALLASLAVLVMGYPCALGMATPLAVIRGSGIAAEKGILLRSGEAFEVFRDVEIMLFDKTGTLTIGKPQITEIVSTSELSEHEILKIAAKIEQDSEHILGKAIIKHAKEKNLNFGGINVEETRIISGMGIEAKINGMKLFLGSPKFIQKQGIELQTIEEILKNNDLIEKEKTIVCLASKEKLLGVILLVDEIRQDAKALIEELRKRKIEPIMVTGDNKYVAISKAKELGLEKYYFELLPDEKTSIVTSFQSKGKRVAMVGDGINDAPALTQADVGIAMGRGTDTAINVADIVIVSERLKSIIDAYEITDKTYRKTRQNVILAFSFNGIGIPIAMTGLVSPVLAMIAMATSVTLVLLNSFLAFPTLTQRKRKLTNNSQRIEVLFFEVPTIHCEGCIQNITEALNKLNGILDVDGDITKKRIEVKYDTKKVNEKKMVRQISSLGHQVIKKEK